MQQNLIHGSIAFDDNLTVFLQAEWSDMEKHQTVILLTRGLKERGKVSEHCNTWCKQVHFVAPEQLT